jgi:hypothetical protein
MSARALRYTIKLIVTAAIAVLAGAAVADATPVPVQLVQTAHFPAEFEFAHGLAVNDDPTSPLYRDVYVFDLSHNRVQVFSSAGAFVEMFGKNVNASAPGDVCKAGETCQPGEGGAEAGQFSIPTSGITIDPSTGDVYVAEEVSANEELAERVQEFTAEGQFVLEIGREVNETRDKEAGATPAQKNLCSAAEMTKGTICGPPRATPSGSGEEGAFNFEPEPGLIAVGGPEDLLLVGDEQRVQEFGAATGVFVRQIPLTPAESKVKALALDRASGEVYLVYSTESMVQRFDEKSTGAPLGSFTTKPRIQGQESLVKGLAVDPSGRLAAVEFETGQNGLRGSLYDPVPGRRVTGFTAPGSLGGMAFNGEGDLYLGEGSGNGEVFVYTPKTVAELTLGAGMCVPGPANQSSAVSDCTLNGEVNPDGVSGTEVFFEYGRTAALGERTPSQAVAASGPVQAVAGMRPNQVYYYQLVGFDANIKPPEEAFTTEQGSLTTETAPPAIVGQPTTLGVSTSSAVLFGELNPENARTEYFFEYGTGEALAKCAGLRAGGCAGVQATSVATASVYGQIGAKAEISGLQPGTAYSYRLFAEDESRANPAQRFQVVGPEAHLTTSPPPHPSAQTGGNSAVTATSAVISGTVNPDGQQAGYVFELGVDNGAATQYTIVQSGSAGSGAEPVAEAMTLTGLQPGTTYAYRIAVTSAYVKNESHTLQGEVETFMTAGIPAVLVSPPALTMLPVPPFPFPSSEPPPPRKCKRGFVRNRHGVCVKKKRKHKRSRKG